MPGRLGRPLRLGDESNRLIERASRIQQAENAGSGVNYEVRTSSVGVRSHHTEHSWLPDRGTFVFLLIAVHLGALCYWCYLTYVSNKKARQSVREPKSPLPRVNCTYDWTSTPGEADMENNGFWSRFKLKPFIDRKDSGRPVTRSELASIGITGSGFPSRSRMTRTPTLPSTPELV